MVNLPLRTLAASLLICGCAWAGPDGIRSTGAGIVLGARVEKRCAACHHIVSATAKTGDRCPYCGVVWRNENLPGRAQAIVNRGAPTVSATVRPVTATVPGRLKDLDDAINAQDGSVLGQIIAVNFVLLGKDGRVQLDADRYLETAIADATANSICRKSRILSSRISDGEVVALVRVYSKRYPADARPEYSTTYEKQTWTTSGFAPHLRLVEPAKPPKAKR